MSDQDDSQSGRDAKGLAGVTAPDDSPSGRGAKVLAAMTDSAEELKAVELAVCRSVHRIRVRCGRFERNAAQMSPDEVLKRLRQKEFEVNVLREQHLRNCQLESLQQASSPMTCGTMPRAAGDKYGLSPDPGPMKASKLAFDETLEPEEALPPIFDEPSPPRSARSPTAMKFFTQLEKVTCVPAPTDADATD